MSARERREEMLQRLLDASDPVATTSAERRALADAEADLELVSLSTDPVAPSSALRRTLLASTQPGHSLHGFVRRTADFFQVDESTADELLASIARVDEEPWFDDVVPGVRMRAVDAGEEIASATNLLVYMEPGVDYPLHRHLGDEWCLFLKGRGLEAGREWNPGDLVRNPQASQHPVLTAIGDEPFVFAVILHEGLVFDL